MIDNLEQDSAFQGRERRRFFRIEDEVSLFFRELESGEIPDHIDTNPEQDFYLLVSGFNRLSEDISKRILRLDRSDEEISEVLTLLNRKIDTLATHFLNRRIDQACECTPPQVINMSAAGIAFGVDHHIASDTLLEIKLILPSSLLAVNAYGRVVHCKKVSVEQGGGNEFQVGVDFVGLENDEREQLIRYIVKKQMQQIREQRESTDTDTF